MFLSYSASQTGWIDSWVFKLLLTSVKEFGLTLLRSRELAAQYWDSV